MRELGDGTLFDAGRDIGVWLDWIDGFRWAADIVVGYAYLDEQKRRNLLGPVSSHESLDAVIQEVEDTSACSSEASGPTNWFGVTCAVGALYRHYVELLLKVVIILGRRIQQEESSFPGTHDLKNLWEEARAGMVAIWPNRNEHEREALDRAAQHIEWLVERDPDSQAFRYPSPDGLSKENALPIMEDLRGHVAPLGNYLRSVAVGMWDVRGEQQNYEEDMRANLPDSDPGIWKTGGLNVASPVPFDYICRMGAMHPRGSTDTRGANWS